MGEAPAVVYILDANTLMQARRSFYPFDICPGYWDALVWHAEVRAVCSIDRVAAEIQRGHDDLWPWAAERFGADKFLSTDTPEVTRWFAEMTNWVQAQPQFLDYAKAEFSSEEGADGWLAAYAKSIGNGVVVTLEKSDPMVKKKVPLPNVCDAFGVEPITPFEMLRRLGVQLSWQPPS